MYETDGYYGDHEAEARDFHYASDAEWDRAGAYEIGALHPDYCNAGGVAFISPLSENDDDWIEVPEDNDEWEDYLKEILELEENERKKLNDKS